MNGREEENGLNGQDYAYLIAISEIPAYPSRGSDQSLSYISFHSLKSIMPTRMY